jgi:hypothetical protein
VVHIVASGVKKVNVVPCLAELLSHNSEADELGEVGEKCPSFYLLAVFIGDNRHVSKILEYSGKSAGSRKCFT